MFVMREPDEQEDAAELPSAVSHMESQPRQPAHLGRSSAEGDRVGDAETTSDTPLSDLIAAHTASGSPESWGRFLDAFQVSEVGVHVVGAPAGVAVEFVTIADRPVSVGRWR